MAGENGNTPDTVELTGKLQRTPYKFGFYQALRRIECAFPRAARFGEGAHSGDDPIRLGQEPSLAFAPATLAKYDPGEKGRRPLLSVYFFGLFGPNGALPMHLTEFARDRMRNVRDFAFSRFMDVFHHRMLSLFYRAWANAQPTVSLDRPDSDRFAVYIGSLAGLGMESMRHRDVMPDYAKFYFAGLLGAQTRNADGLKTVIASFFQVPVRIEEFVGGWLDIPEDSQWRLGESPQTGALGLTTTIGERTWSRQHKFRVVLGPVDYPGYERLLPGRGMLPLLVSIVRNYIGDELTWDMKVVLRADAVPTLSLDGTAQLGWTTWLGDEEHEDDVEDLVLIPMAYAA